MPRGRKLYEGLLKALWVYSYAALVWVFAVLKRTETAWRRRQKHMAGERAKAPS